MRSWVRSPGDQRDITSLLDVSDPHRQDEGMIRGVIAGGSVLTTSGVNDKSNKERSGANLGDWGMDHVHLYSKEGD